MQDDDDIALNGGHKLVINDINIEWKDKLIIAGPCTFASYEEIYKILKLFFTQSAKAEDSDTTDIKIDSEGYKTYICHITPPVNPPCQRKAVPKHGVFCYNYGRV